MTTLSTPPADFAEFWDAIDAELAAVPPASELTELPLHCDEHSTVYAARFTSSGPYRLWAWYSVPKGDGPFPALYRTPGYGSVVHVPSPEDRQQYVVLALRHRGQRRADQPYAAAYPGLLTDGISDPRRYVYRSIAADCIRGLEFLSSRAEVDTKRMAVVGNDLALWVAARRSMLPYLYYAPGPFYRASARAEATSAYPLEELNDYARFQPEQAQAMHRTLAYFEPTHLAPQVEAQTLLVTAAGDEQPLVDAIAGPVDTRQTARSSFRDGVAEATWLAQRLGVREPVLPAQWRT